MRIDDTPSTWDERTTLLTMLDYTRDTVRAKCEGIAELDARSAPLPGSPLTSISALVSHVRWVEYSWIQTTFFGEDDLGPWTDEDPDRELRIGPEIPLAELLSDYAEQSARYRALIDGHDLDERAVRPLSNGDHPTLRWILLHLIEETARHNGHIDLLREMADGVTGT